MKFIPFFLILVLLSCRVAKKYSDQPVDYFEGTIEFTIEWESLNENITVEELSELLPGKMIVHYENGNSVQEYFRNDSLVKRSWFVQATNMNYYHEMGSDTINYSNASITDFTTDAVVQSEGETILGHPTSKVTVLVRGKKGTNYEGMENKLEQYQSLDLPIKPEWYENSYEFGYNKAMKLVPGLSLKSCLVIYNFSRTTMTATKIEWKDVELDLSVDSSKVLIHI